MGWHKLNSDGSSIGNPGTGGAGTIIRDHHGAWVVGSYRYIPLVSSAEAELWGLRDGLQRSLTKLEVEVEDQFVSSFLTKADMSNRLLGGLITDCRCLLDHLEHIRL